MRFFLSLLLVFAFNVWGTEEIQIPALTAPVMDQAGLMSEAEIADLSQLAYEIHAHQGPQITILTVADLQNYPIEEFSIRVAEKWKLGLKEKGNGLLITIAKAERAVRVEVGEGIEGEITDFESNQYITNILTPHFKQADFHGGLRIVLEDVAKKFSIQLEPKGQQFIRKTTPRGGQMKIPFPVILIFIFLLIMNFILKKPIARALVTGGGLAGVGLLMTSVFSIAMIAVIFIVGLLIGLIGLHNILFALLNSGGRGHHGGGGFGGGGGGWSGGGGGFSGGGSSGNW